MWNKSAKRHLKRISKTERKFKRNTNHIIRKRIVSEASKAQKGIAIEDLQNFKKTVRKEDRDKHGKWAFNQLMQFILYKAKIAGVPVALVDPRNTSRTCSKCGHCEKGNRKSQSDFYCKHCGFAINADINSSINIKNRAISAINLINDLAIVLSWALVNEPIVAVEKQHLPTGRLATSQRLYSLVIDDWLL